MDQISKIISLLNDNKNILLTGNAGTGKTTTLLELKKYLEKQHRHTVILAPTGLAAMLVEGLTIHSFFNVRFNFLGTKEGDIY
jgi:adenylylsulfate kinase-like enzyme